MKRKFALILSVLLLVCSVASAQEYVSVAELYEQAQAMNGWWKETFDTPNGEMIVDVPIIVPDVDAMPVLTLEKAKISEEMFNHAANAEALISTSHLLLTKRVNLAFRIVPGGTHSEASWERQIPIFMDCLGL